MAENEQTAAGVAADYASGAPRGGSSGPGYYTVINKMTADGKMMVGSDIEILQNSPCTEFASPGTEAFDANDRNSSAKQFVLLCGPAVVPRVTMIDAYKSLMSRHAMHLITAGIVNWTDGTQRFAFVFDKPLGSRILASPDADPIRIAEDRLIKAIIAPAIDALAELRNANAVHGSINLENMYLSGSSGTESIVLGECLSDAPSAHQHLIYEPIVRAMAKSTGRGAGTSKDDLYALGVCVSMIARGENLMRGRTPQEILHDKIHNGSYASIAGRGKMPTDIAEFLRGVLSDDDGQRWDIDDALHWAEGRRIAPKHPKPVQKAARSLAFMDEKYFDLRSLSQAFSENISEAAIEIEKGQFEQWLKRSFDDPALKTRLAQNWERERAPSREKMVFNTIMILDPHAPPRYRGLGIFPAGFGHALADAMMRGTDIQVYAEFILQQIFNSWLAQISKDLPDAGALTGTFEKVRHMLTQRLPGYGIERVLYVLNPELRCLSPVFKNYCVLTSRNLLLALEDIARKGAKPSAVLDRHMIAFLSVREPRLIDNNLANINSPAPGVQMIGILRTFGAIQKKSTTGPVPAVCGWLLSLVAPAIDLVHDHDLRQELTKRMGKLNDNGNISAILALLDDAALAKDDARRFGAAQAEYAALTQEKEILQKKLSKPKIFGRESGRQVAMSLSCLISFTVIVLCIVIRLTRNI